MGGGLGWLTGKAGLTCDNLVSAQVVTADGEHVTASATSHPDLHWALRGGGGNFGVVTEFEFALHDVGPIVQLGLFFWPLDQGVEMLTFARDYFETTPPDTGLSIVGLNAPPAPFVPEQYQLVPGYVLAVIGWGSPEAHAALVQPILDQLPPLFHFVTPIPYSELQKMLDESAPWGILAYEKAIYLDELTDAAIAVIADQLPRKASPMSIMPIFTMRGAYRNVADDATAFGGSRASKWLVNINANLTRRYGAARHRAGMGPGFWEALLPHAGGSGGYVNFMVEARQRPPPGDLRCRQVRPAGAHQGPLRPGQRIPPQRQHRARRTGPLNGGVDPIRIVPIYPTPARAPALVSHHVDRVACSSAQNRL